MVEGGGGAGFTLETVERLAVLRKLLRQKLKGDATTEARVFGLVHHTHTTTAELLDYTVMGDGLAGHDPGLMCPGRSWNCDQILIQPKRMI